MNEPFSAKGVCTGACCAVFPLSLGYTMFNPRINTALTPDNAYIADMLIPLTVEEADERMARLGYAPVVPAEGWGLFTCRHWDEETRLCGAYETRPKMCSAYPYATTCERGCGYELTPQEKIDTGYLPKEEAAPPNAWEWDEDDKGWRPKSNAHWAWDEAFGVLRRIDDGEDRG
jgi:Fe-S-cluster containining protein